MIGCVLFHGFTGSPYEVAPLAEHLRKHGWMVSCPVLAGHGDDKARLASVTWKDWIKSARDAVEEMSGQCDTLYLVGFSMGGLIAAYMSTQYPVNKLVLLSAAVFYLHPRQMIKDAVSMASAGITSPSTRATWNRYRNKIKQTPLRAVLQFRYLIKRLRPELAKVEVPTLIIHGGCDDLVHPKSPQYIYDSIASSTKEKYVLPRSKHIICHDCEKEKLFQLVDDFLFC